jgi:hypothetical protein
MSGAVDMSLHQFLQRKKGEDGVITSTCVCAVIREWTRLALLICFIVVTDEQFTAKKFGKGSDGGSFQQRGFGRFLVGVLQSMYNELHKGVAMRCSCNDESKGFWEKLNFSSVLKDGGKTEMELNGLVEFFHVKVRLIGDPSE